MKKIFIDGSAGTTGLRIRERLAERTDIELITLSESLRKEEAARRSALNHADIAFLCLPDDAAREAVGMIENPTTVVIDTSTAHRTAPDFAYGFPELSPDFEANIRYAKRIAVPGCHASGFIRNPLLCAPRQYALAQEHKHLKEMKAITGLDKAPVFCPIVSDFYSGMLVTVPLFAEDLVNASVSDIKDIYAKSYDTPVVRYRESSDENGFLSAAGLSGRDSMEISVFGNEERILLVARYDNLGKGASGAAVECLNLVMGCDPTTGLIL